MKTLSKSNIVVCEDMTDECCPSAVVCSAKGELDFQ